jgi:hypothetical protein
MSAAPLISLSGELIEGVTVIRNYHKSPDMIVKYGEKANMHHATFFHDQQLNLWIRLRIEQYLSLVMGFAMFSIVLSR